MWTHPHHLHPKTMPNDKSQPEAKTAAQQESGGDCVSRLVSGSFTPGPWRVAEYDSRHQYAAIEAGKGMERVRVCDIPAWAGDDDEMKANARLIADAPMLFSDLQETRKEAAQNWRFFELAAKEKNRLLVEADAWKAMAIELAYYVKGGYEDEDAALSRFAELRDSSANAERIHGCAGQSNQREMPTPLDDASC